MERGVEMYRDRDIAQGQCSERASERPCGVVESGDRYMDIHGYGYGLGEDTRMEQ